MGNSHGAPVCDPVGGKELSTVFSELDSEHHGWLTLRELLAASSVPGLVMPHSLPVLYYFDTEHDGNLTREEFVALVQYCHSEKVKAEAELLRDKRFRDLIATASAGGVKDCSVSGRSSFRRFSSYSNVRSVYARSASASHTDSDVEAGSQGLSGLSLGDGGSGRLAQSGSAGMGDLGACSSGSMPPRAPSGVSLPPGAPRPGAAGDGPTAQRCPSIAALSSAASYGRSESRLMDAAAYEGGDPQSGVDVPHSARMPVPGAAQAYNSFHSDDSATEQSSSVCEEEVYDQRGASSHAGTSYAASGPRRSVYVESGSELYDLPDPDALAASGMRTGLSSESDSSSSSSSSSSGSSKSSRSASSSRRRGYPRVLAPSVPGASGSEEYDLPPPPTGANPSNVYVESGSELYDLPDPDELAASGMRTGNSSESDSLSSSSSSTEDEAPHEHDRDADAAAAADARERDAVPSVVQGDGFELPDIDALAASGTRRGDASRSSESNSALSSDDRSDTHQSSPRARPEDAVSPSNLYVESGSELYDLPDPDELAASGMRTGNSSESDSLSSSSSSTEDEAPREHSADAAGAAAAADARERDAVPSVVQGDGFELPDIDALAASGTRRGDASRSSESNSASSSDDRSNGSRLSAGGGGFRSTSQQRSPPPSHHRSGSRRHVDSSCSSRSCSSERSDRSSRQGDAGGPEEAGPSAAQGVMPAEGSFVPQHNQHGNSATPPSPFYPEAAAVAAAAVVAGGLSDVTADHDAAVTAAAAAAATVQASASVNDRTIGMFSSQREFDSVASSSGRLQRLRSDSDTSFTDSDLSDHVVSSLDAKSVTALDAAVIEKVTRANIAKLADQLHTEGSREAFMQWLWRLVDSSGTGVVSLDELRVFLEALSEDGIDLEELVFYKERGVPLEERILNEFDTSHSGLLTRDEFMVLADLVTREYEFWENRHLDCIGDYELGRTVGRGSSGVVRAAIHVVTRRKFAVKIIKKGNCSDLSRLDREIQSLTVVQHPNVVSLEEVLDSEDNTFLVMTLCGGGSLIDIVRLYPEERMPEATARFYLRQLFDALAYCHANGICHRDVRLDNIMLGNSGVLKLTDFGHSGIYTPGWDLFSTSLVGSIFNLSPEQIAGRCYSGEKIDVWSAGVLVYCLLVGHPPFYDSDTRKLIDSITTGTFEIPSFVSPLAADFIRLMINVVPDDRPPLATMRRHPWFLEGPENAPVMDVVTIPVDPLYKWRPDLAEMIMAGTIHEHNLHFHLSDTHNPKSCPADLRGQDWALKCLCPNMDIKFSVSLFTKEPTEMAVSNGRCPISRPRPPVAPRARSGEPTPSPRLLISEDLPNGRALLAGESSPSLAAFARTDALELGSASRPSAMGSPAAREEGGHGPGVNPIFSSVPSVDASAGATSSERDMSGSECGLMTPTTRRASVHAPYSSEATGLDADVSPTIRLSTPVAAARRGRLDSPSAFTLSPSRLMRSTSAVHLASTSYLDLDSGADLRVGLGGGEASGGDGGAMSSDCRSELMQLLRRSCSMQDRGEFMAGARLKMTTSRTTDAFPYYCRLQPPPPPPAPPPVPQFSHPAGTPLRTATGRLLRPSSAADDSFAGLDASVADVGREGVGGGVKVESDDDGYEEDGEWSSDGSAERRGAERRSRRRRRRASGGTPNAPGLADDSNSVAIPVPRAGAAEAGVAENGPGGSPSWNVLASSPVGPGIVDRLSKHPSKRFTALQQPRRAGGAARQSESGTTPDAWLSSVREAPDAHPGPAYPADLPLPETSPAVAPGGARSVEPTSFLDRLEVDDDFQPFLEVRLQEGESGLFLRICRKLKTICDTKLAGAAERQKLRAP